MVRGANMPDGDCKENADDFRNADQETGSRSTLIPEVSEARLDVLEPGAGQYEQRARSARGGEVAWETSPVSAGRKRTGEN
jgi:hypothetical protein